MTNLHTHKIYGNGLFALFLGLCLLPYTVEAGGFRLCGRKLTNMITKICDGCLSGGGIEHTEKRSGKISFWQEETNPHWDSGLPSAALQKFHNLGSYTDKSKPSGGRYIVQRNSWPAEKPVPLGILGSFHSSETDQAASQKSLENGKIPNHRRDGRSLDYEELLEENVADQCCQRKCSYSYMKSFCCDDEEKAARGMK